MKSSSRFGAKAIRSLCALVVALALIPAGAAPAYASDSSAAPTAAPPTAKAGGAAQPAGRQAAAPSEAVPAPGPAPAPPAAAAEAASQDAAAPVLEPESQTPGAGAAGGLAPEQEEGHVALRLAGIDDRQLDALGGEDRLLEEFAAYLENDYPKATLAAALISFEGGAEEACAVFELDDPGSARIAVSYRVPGEDYSFEEVEEEGAQEEGAEEEGAQEEGAEEEDAEGEGTREEGAEEGAGGAAVTGEGEPAGADELASAQEPADEATAGYAPFGEEPGGGEDGAPIGGGLSPMASPPKEIVGRFTLDEGFKASSSQSGVAFPGSLAVSGHTVVDYGSNAAGNDRRFYCISPGAANWGDPGNGNNRSGTVYASWCSNDVAAGISWYQVDCIIPDNQPAAPGSVRGIQYLGGGRLAIRQSFAGQIRVDKVIFTDPASLPDDTYSLAGTVFILSRSSSRPASFEDANAVATFTFITNPADSEWARYGTHWDTSPSVGQVKGGLGLGGVGTPVLTGVAPGTYYLYEYLNPAWGMQTGAAWKDPSDISVTVTVEPESTTMPDVVNWPKGSIELRKSSADPALTNGNACYSLAGARYGVYRTEADAAKGTNNVAMLTTDASGSARSGFLEQGSYFVKEITPSPGYSVDPQVYPATIGSTVSVVTVRSVERPLGDPISIVIQKLDTTTGGAWGKDDPAGASLAGGQFTLRYYDGDYATAAEAEASGAPTRTWTVETRGGGEAYLRASYMVFGSDSLYIDSQGFPTIPLGTVLIQETKAPPAYLLPKPNPISVMRVYPEGGTVKRSITTDGATTEYVDRLNVLRIKEQPRSLAVYKRDGKTGELLRGAEFTLYRESAPGSGNWVEIARKTTGANGTVGYSPIGPGSYKLVETKAPAGYMLPSEAGMSATRLFTVDGSSGDPLIEFTFNDHKRPDILVIKRDGSTDKPIGGTGFTLYRYPVAIRDGLVTTDISAIAADDPAWEEVIRVTTGIDGKAILPKLAFGYYQLVETKAPLGYMLPPEAGLANERPFKLERITPLPLTITVKDYAKPDVPVVKLDAESGAPLGGADFVLYRYPAAVRDGLVTTDVSTIAADDPAWVRVASVTTGANGTAVLPKLAFGYYQLVETKAPNGYMLPSEAGLANEQPFKLERITPHPLVVTFKDYAKPAPEVLKLDTDTGAPLGGADFALYRYPAAVRDGLVTTDVSAIAADDPAWEEIASVTTDVGGTAVLPKLAFGYYRLVETKAPSGYMLPSEAGFADGQAFKLESGTPKPLTLTVKDYAKPAPEVLKLDADTDAPLGGADFTLYRYPAATVNGSIVDDVSAIAADDPAWEEIASVTTGTDGTAALPKLAFGYYRLVETKAPIGYMLPSEAGFPNEQTFKLESQTPLPLTITAKDYAKPAPEALKLDADTDAPLDGAGFTLYRYPVVIKDGLVTTDTSAIAADDPAWAEVARVTTDADGKAILPKLAFGYYQLVETKAPSGYMLPSEAGFPNEQTFKLESQTPLPLTITAKDYAKPAPEALKLDADTDAPLGGAGFTLYRYPVVIKDGLVTTDTSAIAADDPAWAEVARVTTDADGKAILPKLTFGYYQLVETKAPSGYMLPSEAGFPNEQPFKLESDTPKPFAITVKDYAKPSLEFAKLDVDTDEPIGDTEFTLYRYPVTVKDGLVTTDTSAIAADDPAWAEVARTTTDADGKAVLSQLVFGYYQLRETRPNPVYAPYEESGQEGRRCFVIDKDATSEVQVFYNEKIQLSCEVYQDTINVTSAGFKTDDEDYLRVENVGTESYHYTLDFRSTSNVRADEFTVVDSLESVATGNVRIEELFTPVARGDTDGRFNLWYRTNLTSLTQLYSTANAMSTNPFNVNNPQQKQMWPSVGWRLWCEGLPTTATTHLSVKDLGLAADEYITALRFEYGSVEVGFTTRDTAKQALQVSKDLKPLFSDWSGAPRPELPRETEPQDAEPQDATSQPTAGLRALLTEPPALKPATYLVSCSSALLPPTVIKDSVVVNIARNAVLSDEDRDAVKTTVIEPFMVVTESTPPTDLSTLVDLAVPAVGALPATGDRSAALGRILSLLLLAAAGALLVRGACRSYLLRRQE